MHLIRETTHFVSLQRERFIDPDPLGITFSNGMSFRNGSWDRLGSFSRLILH